VSNKFFSFIRGGNLHIAPGKKIIPSEQFSDLLDSKELLKKAKQDAIEYRKEVEKECEELKEQSKKEGFEEGLKQWTEKLHEMEEQIRFLDKEYTRKLAPVALKAAQKIVGKAFEMSDSLIFDIVSNALKPVLSHKKVIIHVNREDLTQLESKKGDIKALFEEIRSFSIREKEELLPGECIIETEGGIINATFSNQWNILEKAFRNLFPNSVDKEETEASEQDEKVTQTGFSDE
jgi:type III secretion protein L